MKYSSLEKVNYYKVKYEKNVNKCVINIESNNISFVSNKQYVDIIMIATAQCQTHLDYFRDHVIYR